jgi:acetyltransferase-like isoleucine patch superfamily enzyme
VSRPFRVVLAFRVIAWLATLRSSVRVVAYRFSGAKIGRGTRLGAIKVTVPERTWVGLNCVLEDRVRLRVGGPWGQSSILIGDNTFIGHGTQLNVGSELRIGNDCLIAPGCIVADAVHATDRFDIPIRDQGCDYLPIVIEDDVWVASGAFIGPGVRIGRGAIVAAGAVVVAREIPEYEVWAGSPAKSIGSRLPSD